ncbi:MAG: diaminopimelate epimerase [Oscillospiraceae bacterium]|nr:diaminopimelate epimerase [Oscillospiraceae bacterium]MCI9364022.1 diaminopimelate epimerase [Oscillospiraceae bacterium]RKJ54406.1 diaminopimelate epimerase [bacterium 1XD42-8]RKJ65817.1 diaminopimelate epimerase [bacterium 1XD42-1]
MEFKFSKMHGLGNDYVYVDCTQEKLHHPEEIAKRISDRRFGIGSDGLILICPSEKADFEMRMFNADGSEGRMCGNGIRCVGKYVYDHGLTEKTDLEIDTKSGIKHLKLIVEEGKVTFVEVQMGKASLRPKDIPVETDYDDFISQPMLVGGEAYLVTCVSMGSPHAVIFSDEIDTLPLERIGPLFERHEKFPERINTEFIQVIDRYTLNMRVWERGSGETFACGTGACASVVAAVLNGHCDYDSEITVQLRGGELFITYLQDGSVIMKGPAAHVFDGIMELDI